MNEAVAVKRRPREKPVAIRKDGMKVFGYNTKGSQICHSFTGRGTRCQSTAVIFPTGRCKKHNGKVGLGPANPNFKHGKYADALPAAMRSKMLELAKRDPKDYLSFKDDIDFTDLRLSELARSFGKTVDKVSLKKFGELAEELEDQLANLEEEESQALFAVRDISNQLIELVRQASYVGASFQEIVQTQEHKTKLVTTELKRIEADTKHIAREEVLTNHARLLMAIREVIFDPKWFGKPELQLTEIHRIYTSSGYQPVVAAIEAESRARKREEEEE
jgi:hypothetical protein